jgi:hypothetical protein
MCSSCPGVETSVGLGTKINSSDPPQSVVCTEYPSKPLLTLFDPPVELAGFRPHGRVHLEWRINFPAIHCGKLAQLVVAEIYI